MEQQSFHKVGAALNVPKGRGEAREPVLVLSGGAARGAAHLGFLAAMEASNVRPKAIVGTSAGALMGALFASWNCTTEVPWEHLRALSFRKILRFAFSGKGIFSSAHIISLLRGSLGKSTFEDLPIPLMVAATNWSSRSLELLSSGDLASAVAASCALPPFFTPVARNGSEYLDGGILSLLPVEASRHFYPEELLIAIDANSRPRRPTLGPSKGRKKSSWISMTLDPLWLSISRATLMEYSFADFVLPIPAGEYSLFSLKFIEKIYGLGYDEGMRFFDRKDVRQLLLASA